MGKRQKCDFDTPFHDVRVHMTWTVDEGSPITLRAYAVEASTGVRLTGAKEKKVTVSDIAELPYKQRYLLARVVTALPRREQDNRKRPPSEGVSAMEVALSYIEENQIKIKPTWSMDYQNSNILHFKRHILPRLLARGDDWKELDMVELEQELVEEVLQSGHSIGHNATATNTVRKKLSTGAAIYACMIAVDPSLPDIDIRPTYGGRRVLLEQLKNLPMPIRVRLAAWIVAIAEKNPRLAVAAALMFDCGLRTAEAAAVHASQLIEESGRIIGTYVFYQVKRGVRVSKLKTQSSYRCVPVSAWGADLLKECFCVIGELAAEEPLCDPRILSAELRLALKSCGVDDEYIAEAERTMQRVPDVDDDGKPILDASAYILRRDWATRARTRCGFTTDEIDFCLGHVRKGEKGQMADLKNPEEIKRLSAKLERFVVDPNRSAHPAVKPIELLHGTDLEIIPYDIVRFSNVSDELLRVEVDITAVLSAEGIEVIAPIGSCKDFRRRCPSTKGIRPPGVPLIKGQERLTIKGDGTIGIK